MRKPHPRSRLKMLPPERQKQVFDYLEMHTLAETEAWLALDGLDTNPTSLSEFRNWYPLAEKLSTAESMGAAVKDLLRDLPGLNLDEHQLSKAGQAIFEAQALQSGDSELYLSLRALRQQDRNLDLSEESAKTKANQKEREIALKREDMAIKERRIKLLEEKQDRARAEIAKLRDPKSDLTDADRLAIVAKIDSILGIKA